jgi:chromosome segregation ATPase
MGMAEISLTLVNDDNKLPTEYSEVTITRRIFRSGESEYLLNKMYVDSKTSPIFLWIQEWEQTPIR